MYTKHVCTNVSICCVYICKDIFLYIIVYKHMQSFVSGGLNGLGAYGFISCVYLPIYPKLSY